MSVSTNNTNKLPILKSSAIVVVDHMSKFPAPIAGVITLEPNKEYLITEPLITSDRFFIPDNATVTITAQAFNLTTITYTGTGTLFTGNLVSFFQILDLTIIGNSLATCFNLLPSAAAISQLALIQSRIDGFGSLGNLDGLRPNVSFSAFIGNNNGFTLVNTPDLRFNESIFSNPVDNAGTHITIDGTDDLTGKISGVTFVANPNESSIKISNTIGTNSQMRIQDNSFLGPGQALDSTGLSKKSINVFSLNNPGLEDSRTIGSYTVQNNVTPTVITLVNTWTDLNFNGLALAGLNIERWSLVNATTGELKYDGIPDFSGVFRATCFFFKVGATVNYKLRVVVNGVNGLEFPIEVKSTTVNAVISIPLSDVKQDDLVRIQIKNIDNTDDITISDVVALIQ